MIITRAQSGLKPPRNRVKGDLNKPSTLHWNGPTITLGGKTTWSHDRCAALVRGIQDFHMKPVSQGGRGWTDIAYNFIGCPHGYIFEGRGLNIVNGANGTNAANRNSHAMMSLSGAGNPFPESEKQGFVKCSAYIAEKTNAPNSAVGHRDHKATDCPGNERYKWVHDGMPVKTSVVVGKTQEKELGMEAAIELIKIQYRNGRGMNYVAAEKDPQGWQHWMNSLLDAFDKGTPLKNVTDLCAVLMYREMTQKR